MVFAVLAIIFFLCSEDKDWMSLAGGILVGIYVLLFSYLSRGAVGAGDGIVVLVSGIFIGGGKNALVLTMGFALAGLLGMVLIWMKRANRKSQLPFVPFFALSYGILFLGGLL